LATATRGLKARKVKIKQDLGEATSRVEAEQAVAEKREKSARIGEYIQQLVGSGMNAETLAAIIEQQGLMPEGMTREQFVSDLNAFFLPRVRRGKKVPKLQAQKLRADLAKALMEKPKQTGKPELANPGRQEGARRLVDVVDAHLAQAGYPAPQTVKKWRSEGRRIANDPKRRREIETALKAGTPLQTGSQTVAAMEIYNEAANKAMKSPNLKNIAEAAVYATGYRLGRSETARVMRAGVDQMKTPAERMAEFARRSLTTPPSKVSTAQQAHQESQEWEADSGKPAPVSPELKAWSEDVQKILEKWKKLGIDPAKIDEAIARSPR